MLADRSGDPDVERLIEGFAFLTARIREKIDDSVPEVVHQLADLVFPHLMRPMPAASIVEFTPNMAAMRGTLTIPRGTGVLATPLKRTACQFRTTQDVELVPAQIVDSIMDRSSADRPVLRLLFDAGEGAADALAGPDASLRLFLHGELAMTSTLRLSLIRYCKSVVVRAADGREINLDRGSVRAAGFDPSQSVVPWPSFAPQGLQFLQEYFCLPEKFLFVDVLNLARAKELFAGRFELLFQLEYPPDLPGELQSGSVRLHCCPVVNLFQTSADPISVSTFTREKIVRAAEVDIEHMEIYSVDEVVGIRPGHLDRRNYKRFFDFTHAAPNSEQHYFQVTHVQSPIDDGLDLYLSVHTPRDVAPDTDDEVLSLDLTCTNRSLPGELRVGDICEPGPGMPSIVTVRNIIPVTAPVRPPMGNELHWRLISHLSMNYGTLAKLETLTAICHVYNFQGSQDSSVGYANRRRGDGIRAVVTTPARRVLNRVPARGVATHLELDVANYASLGEAELFAAILNEIFAARVGINSFHELSITVQPSSIDYKWIPRNGQLAIS